MCSTTLTGERGRWPRPSLRAGAPTSASMPWTATSSRAAAASPAFSGRSALPAPDAPAMRYFNIFALLYAENEWAWCLESPSVELPEWYVQHQHSHGRPPALLQGNDIGDDRVMTFSEARDEVSRLVSPLPRDCVFCQKAFNELEYQNILRHAYCIAWQ